MKKTTNVHLEQGEERLDNAELLDPCQGNGGIEQPSIKKERVKA